jgi:hypothetical protein
VASTADHDHARLAAVAMAALLFKLHLDLAVSVRRGGGRRTLIGGVRPT